MTHTLAKALCLTAWTALISTTIAVSSADAQSRARGGGASRAAARPAPSQLRSNPNRPAGPRRFPCQHQSPHQRQSQREPERQSRHRRRTSMSTTMAGTIIIIRSPGRGGDGGGRGDRGDRRLLLPLAAAELASPPIADRSLIISAQRLVSAGLFRDHRAICGRQRALTGHAGHRNIAGRGGNAAARSFYGRSGSPVMSGLAGTVTNRVR